MIKPQVPKGFRDFLPPAMNLRQSVIGIMTGVFERFGFVPLDTSCLEYAETLEGKYGEEGDRLIYKFLDHGGRSVALRYDLTIPLSRVVAQYPNLPRPFKRYQIAPVWRADKPQKGRFREFYQCDIDTVGTPGPYADGELLVVADRVLQELGFSDYTIRINSRRVLDGLVANLGIPATRTTAFMRCLDKLDKVGVDAVVAEMREKTDLDERGQELVRRMVAAESTTRADIAALIGESDSARAGLDELTAIQSMLAGAGIPDSRYRFDITLARGLDYYTGPIFETVVREPRIGSIMGGGRYDGLIGLFSREPVPATGISFGLERIVTVMDELGMHPGAQPGAAVLVTLFDESLIADTMALATMLREAGIATELYCAPVKLKKQLSYAAQRSITRVIIAGPDEMRAGTVTLRDMQAGTQETVARSELVARIRALESA